MKKKYKKNLIILLILIGITSFYVTINAMKPGVLPEDLPAIEEWVKIKNQQLARQKQKEQNREDEKMLEAKLSGLSLEQVEANTWLRQLQSGHPKSENYREEAERLDAEYYDAMNQGFEKKKKPASVPKKLASTTWQSAKSKLSDAKRYMVTRLNQMTNFVRNNIVSPVNTSVRDVKEKLATTFAGFNDYFKENVFTQHHRNKLNELVRQFNAAVTSLIGNIQGKAKTNLQNEAQAIERQK